MLIKKNQSNKNSLRIVVLGSPKTGKSAVTVRYLTKRFIGEYSSSKDFLYHQTLNIGNNKLEIELLDTSDCKINQQCLNDHILWAEAFVIIYSICNFKSFQYAKKLVEKICTLKNSSNLHQIDSSNKTLTTESNSSNFYTDDSLSYNDEILDENLDQQCIMNNQLLNNNQLPVILLGNKRDLEHTREVEVSDAESLAFKFQILFYEVSAAESFIGCSLAFQNLIRQTTNNAFCNLSKEDSLRSSLKQPYDYLDNRHLIDYSTDYFKSNCCASCCSSDTSLKCTNSDKFQLNRRKSITVKSMFGNLFSSKSSRQKKKRPSLSI